jgi:hypothetical protein
MQKMTEFDVYQQKVYSNEGSDELVVLMANLYYLYNDEKKFSMTCM